MCFEHHNLQIFGLKLGKFEYFHPLEVVGRGSEPQLQVGENLKLFNSALSGSIK